MQRKILIGAMALVWMAAAGAADVHAVKSVYLLPMSNALDQYLASSLTSDSILQVVTDPKKADAILTDHVGENFEQSLDELYGSTTPKVEKDKDDKSDDTTTFARVGGGQRSRGTYFLVDRNSRDVVWSDQELAKDNSVKETRRTAARIANRLARALGRTAAGDK
jgi:hypothetical protein